MSKHVFLLEDGNKVEINKFPYNVGSYDGICDLSFENPKINPIHFIIIEDANGLKLKEMNTPIGIAVNGETVNNGGEVYLKPEDIIEIDDVKLVYNPSEKLIADDEINDINSLYEQINSVDEAEGQFIAQKIIDYLLSKVKEISEATSLTTNDEFKQTILNFVKENYDLKTTTAESNTVAEPEEKETETEVAANETILPKEDQEAVKEALKGNNSFDLGSRKPIEIKPEETITPSSNTTLGGRRRIPMGSVNNDVIVETPPVRGERPPAITPTPEVNFDDVQQTLVLEEVGNPSNIVNVSRTPFVIGRSADLSDYILDRRGISRKHATIIKSDNNQSYLLVDNNATNGTYVNNRRIIGSEAVIKPGDVIKLYSYEFRVK